jgi:hypothetical protein
MVIVILFFGYGNEHVFFIYLYSLVLTFKQSLPFVKWIHPNTRQERRKRSWFFLEEPGFYLKYKSYLTLFEICTSLFFLIVY